jgi:hypothetical protein
MKLCYYTLLTCATCIAYGKIAREAAARCGYAYEEIDIDNDCFVAIAVLKEVKGLADKIPFCVVRSDDGVCLAVLDGSDYTLNTLTTILQQYDK